MSKYVSQIAIAKKALKKGIRPMIRDFGELEHLQSSTKSLDKFCAATFENVSKRIIDEFNEIADEYGLFLNEKSLKPSTDFNFHINISDGLYNFSRALPFFALSISYEQLDDEGNSERLFTICDSPILGEALYAEKAAGAFVEKYAGDIIKEIRLRVSVRKSLANSTVVFGDLTKLKKAKFYSTLIKNSVNFITLGSDALAMTYFAAGKADIAITGTNNFELIAKEAGGFIYDVEGNPATSKTGPFVSTNEYLDKQFFELLKTVK
jgi:myo-inositol-1(or 4)-monophosphatase